LTTVYFTPETCLKLLCLSSVTFQRLCTYYTNSGNETANAFTIIRTLSQEKMTSQSCFRRFHDA
jgi:hypothetical protein